MDFGVLYKIRCEGIFEAIADRGQPAIDGIVGETYLCFIIIICVFLKNIFLNFIKY